MRQIIRKQSFILLIVSIVYGDDESVVSLNIEYLAHIEALFIAQLFVMDQTVNGSLHQINMIKN